MSKAFLLSTLAALSLTSMAQADDTPISFYVTNTTPSIYWIKVQNEDALCSKDESSGDSFTTVSNYNFYTSDPNCPSSNRSKWIVSVGQDKSHAIGGSYGPFKPTTVKISIIITDVNNGAVVGVTGYDQNGNPTFSKKSSPLALPKKK